jgi:ferredoxin-NADP reductase
MATNAVLVAVQAKLIRREEVAEGTMAFHLEKPSGFNFKAGQFVDVTLTDPHVPRSRNRNYSLSQHRAAGG